MLITSSRSICKILIFIWLSSIIFPHQAQSFCYNFAQVDYNALPTSPPQGSTIVTFTQDDQYSGVVTIPFTFNFFGSNFNQLVIGSKGVLSFDITLAGGTCPGPSSTCPVGEPTLFKSIMFPWQDLDPSNKGTVFYFTQGTAPNRQFIVVFNQISSLICSDLQTQGVILYETTHCIDIVIGNKTSCGGIARAAEGLQNADTSQVIMVTGRNDTPWDTSQETDRFCPLSCFCASSPSAILGATTVCAGSSQVYSIEAVPGATSYTWTVPTGWNITNNSGTSITVLVGDTSGTITVQSNEDTICSSVPQELNVTVNTVPAQPGAISGPTTVCKGLSQCYAIAPVSGATSYTWSVPLGWVITNDLGTSITVTVGDIAGSVGVTANNSCGSSSLQTLDVKVKRAKHHHIHGPRTVELGDKVTYSISHKSHATFAWSYSGSGVEIHSSGKKVTLKFGPQATSGTLSVVVTNRCGRSFTRTLAISIRQ